MKIICIGRNYAEHAKELNNEIPDEPVLFIKPDSAVLRNKAPFYLPEFTNDVHHEIELVVKICKPGKAIPVEFAHNYYKEITVGIDFTARDIQQKQKDKGLPWEIAKAFDHSAVIGDFIPIEALNLASISFELYKNGVVVQAGNNQQMIHSIDQVIAHASKYFSLKIGDLIFTGTPKGVGKVVPEDLLEGYLEGRKLLKVKIK